jgi:hypothetical protein
VLKEIGAPPYWRKGFSDWDAIYAARAAISSAATSARPRKDADRQIVRRQHPEGDSWRAKLNADAGVVIFNKPTYGLDLQNTRLAHERILAGADAGLATLVISTDLDELLELSDRIGVMFQGPSGRHRRERPGCGAPGRPADDRREGGMMRGDGNMRAGLLPPLRGKVGKGGAVAPSVTAKSRRS